MAAGSCSKEGRRMITVLVILYSAFPVPPRCAQVAPLDTAQHVARTPECCCFSIPLLLNNERQQRAAALMCGNVNCKSVQAAVIDIWGRRCETCNTFSYHKSLGWHCQSTLSLELAARELLREPQGIREPQAVHGSFTSRYREVLEEDAAVRQRAVHTCPPCTCLATLHPATQTNPQRSWAAEYW